MLQTGICGEKLHPQNFSLPSAMLVVPGIKLLAVKVLPVAQEVSRAEAETVCDGEAFLLQISTRISMLRLEIEVSYNLVIADADR